MAEYTFTITARDPLELARRLHVLAEIVEDGVELLDSGMARDVDGDVIATWETDGR